MSSTGISQADVDRFIEREIKSPSDFGKTLSLLDEFGVKGQVGFKEFRDFAARALCIKIQGALRPSSTKKLNQRIQELEARAKELESQLKK